MLIHGRQVIFCDPQWRQAAGRLGLERYEQIIGYASGEPVNRTQTTETFHIDAKDSRWPGGIFLKKFRYRRGGLRFWFRASKPSVERRNYTLLQRLGINVPKVLAIGQRRVLGGVKDGFIITAGIEDTRSLEQLAGNGSLGRLCRRRRLELIGELARIVRTMHRHDVYHIDLQWRNVLLRQREGRFEVFLIDSPRGGRRRLPLLRSRGRLRDLSSLDKLARKYLSASDRLRWYKLYAGSDRLTGGDKRLIRRVWADRRMKDRPRHARPALTAVHVRTNHRYEALVKRHGLDDLNRLLAWRQGRVVGEHGPRRTLQVELACETGVETFYLKQERGIAWRDVIEQLLSRHWPASRSLRQWRAIQLLQRAGLEPMEAVCVAEKRFLGVAVQAGGVVKAVPGRDVLWQLRQLRQGRAGRRHRLVYQIGSLVGRLHAAGLSWPDLVGKHIYVSTDHVGNWRLGLIDLERVEVGLTQRRRQDEINGFLASLRSVLSPTDLLRLAYGYLGLSRDRPGMERRRLLGETFAAGMRHVRRARWETRALKRYGNSAVLPEDELFERFGPVTVNHRFRSLLQQAGLAGEAAFTYEGGTSLVKPGLGRRQRIRLDLEHEGATVTVYMKRLRRPGLGQQLRRVLFCHPLHSTCWWERYMIKQLGAARIPTVTVAAWGEKMLGLWEQSSVLITEAISGQSLEQFLPAYAIPQRGPQLRRWRAAIDQLAALIGDFHRAGFCHRDLYASHVFVSFEEDGRPIFRLIDLARAFKVRWRRRRWLVKDLAALNYSTPAKVSRTDRLRFLKRHLGLKRLDGQTKRLARSIAAKTRRIAAHDAKKRRQQDRTVSDNPGSGLPLVRQ